MVKRDCGDWPGAIIVAAATERILLQLNQFGRQTRSAPSSRIPGRSGAAFFAKIGQARLRPRRLVSPRG
jgi:hypothetical protein